MRPNRCKLTDFLAFSFKGGKDLEDGKSAWLRGKAAFRPSKVHSPKHFAPFIHSFFHCIQQFIYRATLSPSPFHFGLSHTEWRHLPSIRQFALGINCPEHNNIHFPFIRLTDAPSIFTSFIYPSYISFGIVIFPLIDSLTVTYIWPIFIAIQF